jgi:hypothetical protein
VLIFIDAPRGESGISLFLIVLTEYGCLSVEATDKGGPEST